MKTLFTADWHIKLGQKNVPKEWSLNRYKLFFEKVEAIDCDLHIIGGDIFDRNPTLEELALYFEFVTITRHETLIYSGNHESLTKKKTFLEYLAEPTKAMNNKVNIITKPLGFDNCYIIPYEFIKNQHTWINYNSSNIVFTHVRGAIEPHVKPEIPLEWLEKYPIVIAGDLHSHKNSQKNIIYPGSPMTTLFHRSLNKGDNGYLLINTETKEWEWYDFELPQLIRKTASTKEEMIPTSFHHTIYEVEGTMDTLLNIESSELLDKKIVKRNSDVELILTEKMSIEQELIEYLTYIIDHQNIDEVMTAYYEYN